MKDAFHGSAHPAHGLVTAYREQSPAIDGPYRGCTRQAPRRGTARTAPMWIQRASVHCFDRLPRIVLDLETPYAAVPCWSGRAQRWVSETVPAAYRVRYETHVRPVMPNNPVSLESVVRVAEARARFADHRTGRDCRPTNERLAEITGLSVRTVQRASTALRLLGVATEVMRGRQRTRAERYASWRLGDRGRGWASVWALHDNRFRVLSPHPVGSKSGYKSLVGRELTTPARQAGSAGAGRRTCPDSRALALANKWIRDEQSPPWARRFHTGTPWVRVLAGPARHGWTARDVNQLITDWIGTGHWMPDSPHKPIGLLGRIIAVHGNLEERPAALDVAREQAELAEARRRVASQFEERETARRAREAGRAALSGPGREAVRRALADAVERTRRRQEQSDRSGPQS